MEYLLCKPTLPPTKKKDLLSEGEGEGGMQDISDMCVVNAI